MENNKGLIIGQHAKISQSMIDAYGKDMMEMFDKILPGGLGEVMIASTGQRHDIVSAEKRSDSVTITIRPEHYYNNTEDAEFEEFVPDTLEERRPSAGIIGLCKTQALNYLHGEKTEDAECEVLETNRNENKSFDENVKDFMNVGDTLTEAVYHAHGVDMFNFFKDILQPKQLTNG